MTFKQLQKKLVERRIVLTMNYLVRKKLFYVQATRWNTPAAKCQHPDLEVAIEAVLAAVAPVPTPTEAKQAREERRTKKIEDKAFS